MSKYNDFDKRMKDYETVSKTRLTKRMPVVIRVDGRAFHTFTKGFNKPYDELLCSCMQETMKYLCENIQGCVLGYTQSDEITLILVDYDNIDKSAWFDYEVQKICSVVSSMSTMKFNKLFERKVTEFISNKPDEITQDEYVNLCSRYDNAINMRAMFDTRCFNVPENDICNAIIWRQRDAEKNSISSLGQAYFTQNFDRKIPPFKVGYECQNCLQVTRFVL